MKVLIATSEAVPFAKTGGLADVTGALVNELRTMGLDARLIMPLYRGIKSRFNPADTGHEVEIPLGKKKYRAKVLGYEDWALFLECDEFYNRKDLYGTSLGDYADNAFRFVFFSRSVLEACELLGFKPDIIHCNDWQTGLIPLYVKTLYRKSFGDCSTLFSIHNMGYQGIFPASAMTLTGLDKSYFNPEVLEFYGQVNLLKAGIASADALSTVSETYAAEIATKKYGFGLDGLIRKRTADLTGITNGLNYGLWDPERDKAIPHNYGLGNVSGKNKCRDYLARECNFRSRKLPVASVVGRLSHQKGIDLFIEAADGILSNGVNIVVLGKGDDVLQRDLRKLAKRFPENISLNIGFDEDLAHIIYAGSDMLIIPSRYEPCGLIQMIAMRYGTVPVARATGGLRDTIEDYNESSGEGTGFLFSGENGSSLEECFKRALCVYTKKDTWTELRERCMEQDFSWDTSGRKYVSLYRKLVKKGK